MQATRLNHGKFTLALTAAILHIGAGVAAQVAPPAGKMWLLEEPPVEHIKEVYGFEITEEWVQKTRLSGLRYGGGTASFVSPYGLILTNHHVVRGDLSQMEHDGKNLGVNGYVAHSMEEELPIPGRSVRQLVHVEDVTSAIFQGVDLRASFEEVEDALAQNKRSVLARARGEHAGLITELVTLYRGARVHLYVYKVYTDVRIAFAPHLGAAYFGGDTDNFRYPRFALDFSLCRVYDDGEPLDSSAFHFGWSDGEFEEGEVIFSLGNPGRTDRLLTVAELEYQRDALYPARNSTMTDFLAALDTYAGEHPESEHQLRELYFGLANGHKSSQGILEGLRDPELIKIRRAAERDLRARVAQNSELDSRYGSAWEEIEFAMEELEGAYERWWYQTPWYGQGRWFRPLQRAMSLVEDFHPDFLDENRISIPPGGLIYPFDPDIYAAHLAHGREVLGADDPAIEVLLRGREPVEAVRALMAESQLASAAFESKLRAGGWDAISASDDPAVVAACVLYPLYVQNIEERALLRRVIAHQAILVGKATDAIEGPVVCPEATFSQRLSAGFVSGYTLDGQQVPVNTRFAGLFERCAEFGDEGEFNLPDIWFEKQDAIDLDTPLNLVCTVDSTGGSSGSPIFNRQSQIVGVLFDGNEQAVEDDFVYKEGAGRAIVVHSAAILETLTAVYGAPSLAAELTGEGGSW